MLGEIQSVQWKIYFSLGSAYTPSRIKRESLQADCEILWPMCYLVLFSVLVLVAAGRAIQLLFQLSRSKAGLYGSAKVNIYCCDWYLQKVRLLELEPLCLTPMA